MKIGLFAHPEDRPSRQLQARLEALAAGSTVRFGLDFQSQPSLVLDADMLAWNGIDLSGLDAAFVHGFLYCDPVVPSGSLERDWSVWRYDYLREQQEYSTLHSLLLELARRGVPVVNDPDAHMAVFPRAALLERLRRAGLGVPDFLCTSSLDDAAAFAAKHRTVVWRPSTGRAIWQLCLETQRDALIQAGRPPVLLAAAVAGQLYRTYLFGGRPILTVTGFAPTQEPPERLEFFQETVCPAEALESLARVAEVLEARWLEVQFVLAEGKPVFFDVDADPYWDSLPGLLQERLVDRLAGSLLGREVSVAVGAGEKPVQRPTMFLRRMLRVLFEIEEAKYS